MSLLLSFALAGAAALSADKSASPPTLDRAVATAFATCVAAKHPVEGKRYVLHQYGGDWRASDGDYRKLKDRACVPSQTSKDTASSLRNISEDQLKMILAEALVRQDLARFDTALIETAQPLSNDKLVDQLWKHPEECEKCKPEQLKDLAHVREVFNARLIPHLFSECVVRADPAKSHELLMTQPNSASERQAFSALASALTQCAKPDQQFSVTRAALRGFLALYYYRVAFAPRIATASAGANK